jgi:hypothetical protein
VATAMSELGVRWDRASPQGRSGALSRATTGCYGPALTHSTEKLELSLPSIEGTAFRLPLLSTMVIS